MLVFDLSSHTHSVPALRLSTLREYLVGLFRQGGGALGERRIPEMAAYVLEVARRPPPAQQAHVPEPAGSVRRVAMSLNNTANSRSVASRSARFATPLSSRRTAGSQADRASGISLRVP